MFRKRSYSLAVVGLLLVITMILLLYGSRLFTDIEEETHITQENRIVVGVSQLGSESGWRTAHTDSLQRAFTQQNGYFLIFNNARQKQENQLKAIRSFISQRVDYIVFSPVVETGWETVLQEAKQAGIPVILMDRNVDVEDESLYVTCVGSNFVEEGEKAGRWLERELVERGRSSQSTNIVILMGTEGSSSQIGRSAGFAAVAARHNNWNILEEKCAEFTSTKGKEVMKTFLHRYPEIDVVVSQNDDMTFGAIEAIRESGRTVGVNGDIMILSFDAVRGALDMVADGVINVDIECNPNQGEYLLRVIDMLEADETIEKKYYVEEDVFTIENVTEEVLHERGLLDSSGGSGREKQMLKVFLVEDESIVREGLRDNIPWQQYGYEFVGEASDGEMALPLIQKTKPDVLLTDIKMPFMDGLSLSRLVHQEFPDMKIIIISGYDDFEYARGAILVGAEQYLLKPVTRAAMQKVLAELKTKIETEREQKTYQEKFQSEVREYEQFSRTDFFVKVFEGRMPVQDIYEEAAKLSLKINASCYNILLFNLQEKRTGENWGTESEDFARKREELLHYFIRYPENLVFRWNVNTYGVLIKGSPAQMQELGARCLENVERICHPAQEVLDWYVALGEPVERLSMLAECYSSVNHIFAYRFLMPQVHVFTKETMGRNMPEKEEGGRIRDIDPAKMDTELIRDFLLQGARDEITDFVENYLLAVGEALQSAMFRNYLTLHVYFAAVSYVESLGCDKEELLQLLHDEGLNPEGQYDVDTLPDYFCGLIEKAVELRDRESENRSKRILKKALSYIEENYSQEALSLNSVAGEVNVSANYFSAIFSQAMQVTFVEYVTGKRMDKAKKLLRQTQMHTGEIAMEVGYKDPHYFSFVFKKTQGCTPREYRART